MKPKLLLLHGALGTRNQFAQIKPLLEAHFDVYDFNFEGHGGVISEGEYSITHFAKNTKDFIHTNDLGSVSIFGYSMGGYVALKLALESPELIEKMATLGTKFAWTKASAAAEVKMLNPDVIEEKVPHFAQLLKEMHAPLDWKAVMRNTAEMMLNLGNGEALVEDDFKKINHTVCLGIGAKDKMVSQEETEKVQGWLPNSICNVLEGAPHPIEKVDPDSLFEYIKKALL